MERKCVYIRHGPCPDGLWAALPFWLAVPSEVRGRLGPDPEKCNHREAARRGDPLFFGARPGNKPPPADLLAGRHVYLLDFCYDGGGLATLLERVGPEGRITIIDHHASNVSVAKHAQDLDPDRVEVLIDTERSAAQISWEFVRARGIFDGECPVLVPYIADHDLWKWELPDSREINAGLELQGHNDSLCRAGGLYRAIVSDTRFVEGLILAGGPIVRYRMKFVESAARYSALATVRTKTAETYTVRVVNAPFFQNEIGHAMAKMADRSGALPDFAAVWYHSHHGDGSIKVSLRRRKSGTVDLSEIAANIEGATRGGGHPSAAGCVFPAGDVREFFRPLCRKRSQ